MTLHNKSVNRSWLVLRFFKLVSFGYHAWCANVNSVGPPTRLPQTLLDQASPTSNAGTHDLSTLQIIAVIISSILVAGVVLVWLFRLINRAVYGP